MCYVTKQNDIQDPQGKLTNENCTINRTTENKFQFFILELNIVAYVNKKAFYTQSPPSFVSVQHSLW